MLNKEQSEIQKQMFINNMVDEAIYFEKVCTDLDVLKSEISKGKPVCPHCKESMREVNYVGYYDKFSFWECGCDNFKDACEQSGAYA